MELVDNLSKGEGIDFLKGASPLLIPLPEHLSRVSKRGVSPSFFSPPSPLKERGIKGVRLTNNRSIALPDKIK